MNKKKVVSIVVPVYNTEEYLRRCLDSLLLQTYPYLEIIVVNDASTGDVENIVTEYQLKDDRIFYVKNETNQGLFKSRVNGSLQATGEYLAFVDSDDYIGIDYYRLLIENATENQSDIVLARTVMVEKEKVVFGMHDIAFPDQIVHGDAVLNMFLAQEGRCYSWHTMWNKLYKKSLWDQCVPYFKKQEEHIVMMEDIAFSFPLFYFAKKMSKVSNSVYYYCQNKGSSTDVKSASVQQLEKNLGDIFKVFDFVKLFLSSVQAPEDVIQKFYDFRNYYSRDWKKGLENLENEEDRVRFTNMIIESYGEIGEFRKEDRLFRTTRTIWNDELEEIKKKIWRSDYEYISFDFFDTLITRPFYRPTDLFYLLDKRFEQETQLSISFQQVRIDAEIATRALIQKQHPEYQDITIDEIYEYIQDVYGISADICNTLKEEERNLEIKFTNPRKTISELYQFALYAGKKIIIVSDMYLDEKTITRLLAKNGYADYQKIFLSSKERVLKHTGDLFRKVLDDLQVEPNRMLHLGDNYHSDILKAGELGIHTAFIPRTINIFENKVKGFDTGECSALSEKVSGVILDRSKLLESTGYGSMVAIAANYYFDNPFRPFNSETDYNADPYFIGYYAVGMHLAGLVKWIQHQADSHQRVLFMARDGFLVKEAYDIWTEYTETAPKSKYVYSSRKLLLPASLEHKVEFMNLPILYNQYSPKSIMDLLHFCTQDLTVKDREEKMLKYRINENERFNSKYDYQNFMKIYLDEFYDNYKHQESKELLTQYYKDVQETDITFDLGYSGNIQNSFVRAVGQPVDVMFVHSDAIKSRQLSRKGNFEIKTFYDFSPAISGLLREHILSDYNASCVGLQREGTEVVPIFEMATKPYTDTFVIDKIHQGARAFINNYCETFSEYFDYITFKNYEISLPFEAFLRIPKGKDLQIFEGSYFEDDVFGKQNAINIAQHMENQYKVLPQFAGEESVELFRTAFIDSMRVSRKLAYFGGGKIGREILAQYSDLPVKFFLDNDRENSGKNIEGIEIKHPGEIENWKDIYIIITTYRSSEIEKQLKDLGLQKYSDYINFNEIFRIL
ncbi:HAD-IA family hydrolase [Paenibacillus sp. TSA_86.1]|uniref:HAD-IA family hydrolase n=1 Tax=Paenibacillus sp. TSA_86.1 TaxID=3415649 RepID=UPI0040462B2D